MESFQLHQPTFGIKGILGCLQQTVGLGYISFNTCDHTVALEVTIIVAVLHQARVPYQHTVVDPTGDAVVIVHTALILLEHAIFVKDEQRTLTVRIVVIVRISFLPGDIDFGIFRIGAVAGQQLRRGIRYTNHSGDGLLLLVEGIAVSIFPPTIVVDHFAALQQFVAYRAVGIAGVTVLGVSDFLYIPNFFNMPLGRDNFLCNKNLIAGGAMLAFRLAAFCAGSRNSFIDYFRMPLSRNLFLRYKHFIANRAMFAFGLAGRGASSCNSFVDYFRMPLSRNLFLRYKHFIANRAMFAFGLAGCGAGSFNGFVDHLGMTRSRNLFNSGDRCAAD